jgi:hypothetical protein
LPHKAAELVIHGNGPDVFLGKHLCVYTIDIVTK